MNTPNNFAVTIEISDLEKLETLLIFSQREGAYLHSLREQLDYFKVNIKDTFKDNRIIFYFRFLDSLYIKNFTIPTHNNNIVAIGWDYPQRLTYDYEILNINTNWEEILNKLGYDDKFYKKLEEIKEEIGLL
jgi:hypothetical protein